MTTAEEILDALRDADDGYDVLHNANRHLTLEVINKVLAGRAESRDLAVRQAIANYCPPEEIHRQAMEGGE